MLFCYGGYRFVDCLSFSDLFKVGVFGDFILYLRVRSFIFVKGSKGESSRF